MGKYTVYCHINKTNGKRYIGITRRKPNVRWNNGKNYYNAPIFHLAIEKYGWNGFEHEIIATGLEKEEAEAMEIELIQKYRTTEKEFRYNRSKGGTGGNNKPVTPVEQYDKDGNFIARYDSAADAARAIGCDRAAITSCCKGRHNLVHGYQFKYENDDREIGVYTRKNYVSVDMYDLDGNFIRTLKTMREARKYTNGLDVWKCVHGIEHSAGGYIWKYHNEVNNDGERKNSRTDDR